MAIGYVTGLCYTQSNGKKRYDSTNHTEGFVGNVILNSYLYSHYDAYNYSGKQIQWDHQEGIGNNNTQYMKYYLAYDTISYAYIDASNTKGTYFTRANIHNNLPPDTKWSNFYFNFNKKANYVSYTCKLVINHDRISAGDKNILNYIRITANGDVAESNAELKKDSNYSYIYTYFDIDMNSLTDDKINGNKPVYNIYIDINCMAENPYSTSNFSWTNSIYDIYPIIAPSSDFNDNNPDTKYENHPMFVGNYKPVITYGSNWKAGWYVDDFSLISDEQQSSDAYIGINIDNLDNTNDQLGGFQIQFYNDFMKNDLLPNSPFNYSTYIKNRFIGSNLSFLYNININANHY